MEGKILTQTLRFPIWILRSEAFVALRRQSPLALRVLLCIWAHGQGYGTRCFPGEKRLAALCKTSVPSISQAIKLLELAGWLGVLRQRELGRGNIYTLRVPESLGPLAGRIQTWLEGPSSGSEPAPQEAFVLQAGDLWGQAGKGRRRCRVAWISLANMNSDLWDLLWRTEALAGHLWLLLQAYGPSGEQVSLSRL
ncbi:MAG TPA: helix-turn-helix domain-containing protein, partial [Myxococcota bacterium]|nr:helix-turn-helix domain-containing protein [Myxococcota bacterium]